MAKASYTTAAADGGISVTPTIAACRMADHITLLTNVTNALWLAVAGLRAEMEHGQPGEAAIEGLEWLSGHARAVCEGVHACAHGEAPRWNILSPEADLRRDAEAAAP